MMVCIMLCGVVLWLMKSAGQDDEEGDDDDSPEEVKRRIQFLRALQVSETCMVIVVDRYSLWI